MIGAEGRARLEYAELGQEVVRAAETYVREVKEGAFPTDAQAFAPPKTSTGAA